MRTHLTASHTPASSGSTTIVAPFFDSATLSSILDSEGYQSDDEDDSHPACGSDHDTAAPVSSLATHLPSPVLLSSPPHLTKTQRNNPKNRRKRGLERDAAQRDCEDGLKECVVKRRRLAAAVPHALDGSNNTCTDHPMRAYLLIAGASDRACELISNSALGGVCSTSPSNRLHTTKPAWVNKTEAKDDQDWNEYCLEDLQDRYDMTYVDWAGQNTCLVADKSSAVVSLLGEIPQRPDWDDFHVDACTEIERARPLLYVSEKDKIHRRGAFPAFQLGITHGNGRLEPGMRQNGSNKSVLEQVFAHEFFQRVSSFSTGLLRTYAPRLHDYYQNTIDQLMQRDKTINRLYEKCAFAYATLNFGPRTVSFPHLDHANLSWGYCGITAMGDFNADEGDHLVLWDLKLIIRFPAGSTILVPSAMIRHSTTSIPEGQHRYSFIQYSAGGLFRWVENGFVPDAKAVSRLAKVQQAERMLENERRWGAGLKMLSTLSELKA